MTKYRCPQCGEVIETLAYKVHYIHYGKLVLGDGELIDEERGLSCGGRDKFFCSKCFSFLGGSLAEAEGSLIRED